MTLTLKTALKQKFTFYTALAGAMVVASIAPAFAMDNSLDGLKERIVGNWKSISCEVRPQPNQADPALAPTPSYLTRDFTYGDDDSFSANITVYADPACSVPMIAYDFAGEIKWHGENPAVKGAWSQDYILNKQLDLKVMAPPMADQLNQLPDGACREGEFVVGETKDILGKPCVLLKFVEGSEYVIDHDFLYVREDTPNMLFMGGKHVDGTGFYSPENRPTVALQQPLIKTN